MATKSDKTPKVMDVSQPGKTAPPASAKPIIVTNRPILRRDPMVAEQDDTHVIEKQPTPQLARSRPMTVITPVSDANSAEPTAPAAATSATSPESMPTETKHTPKTVSVDAVEETFGVPDKKVVAAEIGEELLGNGSIAEPIAVKVTSKPAPTAAEITAKLAAASAAPSEPKQEASEASASKPEDKPSDDDSTPVPGDAKAPTDKSAESGQATAEEANTDDKSAPDSDGQLAPNQAIDEAKRKEEEAKAARKAEQEKVIDSKQFYLPIQNAEKRGTRRAAIILILVVVLSLAWADIVIDAGILHIPGVPAVTNFFK